MIKLIDKQKMIIKYFNEGLSRRQIEKELHIGRKTISRYLKEYEYIWATIDTGQELLSIYHDSKLVEKLNYPLPKTYIELSKIDL